jgi:hypothetical protein
VAVTAPQLTAPVTVAGNPAVANRTQSGGGGGQLYSADGTLILPGSPGNIDPVPGPAPADAVPPPPAPSGSEDDVALLLQKRVHDACFANRERLPVLDAAADRLAAPAEEGSPAADPLAVFAGFAVALGGWWARAEREEERRPDQQLRM